MSQLRHHILRDAAIAAHASGPLPAWLFSGDGARLLFANAVGAAMLGAPGTAVPSALATQLERSAALLRPGGQPRLERLRGLGTQLGRPLTCKCALVSSEGEPAILVTAIEPAGPKLTLAERARYLIENSDAAAAAFDIDGAQLHANKEASHHISNTASLSDLGDDVETLRVGSGSDVLVLAFFPDPAPEIQTQPAVNETGLLDLSPIAEAITAMVNGAPRNGHANGHTEAPAAIAPAAETIARETPTQAQPEERRHPLRFVWEADAENRFTIDSDAFIAVAGPRTANLLGRFWGEISAKLALDPEGQIARALVSRHTFGGITVNWPMLEGDRVAVTLSGIPVFDQGRVFRGYRGLGVLRNGERTNDAELLAVQEPVAAPEVEAPPVAAAEPLVEAKPAIVPEQPEPIEITPIAPVEAELSMPSREAAVAASEQAEAATSEEAAAPAEEPVRDWPTPPENVVLFPSAYIEQKAEAKALNPAERSAFREISSRLSARLRGADELARGLIEKAEPDDEPPYLPPPLVAAPLPQPDAVSPTQLLSEPRREPDDILGAERSLLDRLPFGLLIYRGANLLYANPAFLTFAGRRSLSDLEASGGLDAMHVEFDGGPSAAGEQSLRIAASDGAPALQGRLVTVSLRGENAQMLMLQPAGAGQQAAQQYTDSSSSAADIAALLDIAADGAVTVDRNGAIVAANARAETLFGYGPGTLTGRPFRELFALDSERIAVSRLERLAQSGATRDDDHHEIVGRRRDGGFVSLQLTLGRSDPAGTRFYALFRDMTRWKEAEKELTAARQQAEQASAAKSEFLAKISHEMRTPLNAILGFSEVMMEERFGSVGNDRYRDYLKDIYTSGTHLVSLLNDLLDLSKIEAGKMELSFEHVDLNEVTQQSVAIMQPQASRARVIVRSALSMNIPGILADTRSVRQIVLNLLSNSIKFTGPGGQVIVSTATNDRGDVVLRVRDTGIGMSEKDIETALQPFRQVASAQRGDADGTGTGLGLPLTKALVEANRARFSIKSAVNAGTLVQIVFPAGRVLHDN